MALRVLMFGTDGVAVHTLRALVQSWRGAGAHPGVVSHLELVCPADKPRGRGNRVVPVPTNVAATQEGVTVHTLPARCKSLRAWQSQPVLPLDPTLFDIAVVCSFGFFMPKSLLQAFPRAGINMHPSLLPKYRGAAPLEHTLLNGDEVSGVSVIELDPDRFDAGRILLQQSVEVSPTATYPSLANQLGSLGADAIVDVLATLDERRATAVEQDEDRVVHAPKLPSDVGHSVQWSEWTCGQVYNLWRAVGDSAGILANVVAPTLPTPRGVRVVELGVPGEAVPAAWAGDEVEWAPGSLRFDKKTKSLWLRCVDGWLRCARMQVTGRQVVSGADFASGYVLGKANAAKPGLVRLASRIS